MEWETNDIYGICWKNINRENFVSLEQKQFSHLNKPIPIKKNQTTSQPTLITFMIEKMYTLFKEKNTKIKNIKVLDIGSGSGVVTALMACLIKNNKGNIVIGIDKYEKLVDDSNENILKIDKTDMAKMLLKKLDVYDLFNNPSLLLKKKEKFDMIYVGAEPKAPIEISKFKKKCS